MPCDVSSGPSQDCANKGLADQHERTESNVCALGSEHNGNVASFEPVSRGCDWRKR